MNGVPRRAFVAIVAGAASGCLGSATREDAVDVSGNWPLVGNGPGNRRTASGSIDAKPTSRWDFGFSTQVVGSPVVSDGRLFISTENSIHGIGVDSAEQNWRTRLDGIISGAPAATGDKIYVTADTYGSESEDESGWLYRLDPSSDTVDWRFEFDTGRVFTPIAVGDTVYTRTATGVTAVATDGTRRWEQTDVPSFPPVDRRYANELTSAVHDGIVFAPTPASIVALDAASGKRQWEYPLEKCRVGPTVTDDGTVFATDVANGVAALDAADGSELWTWDAENVWGGTALSERSLLVTTGTELVALNRRDGSERWRFRLDGDSHGSPIAVGGTAAVGTVTGTLSALSIESGELQWRRELGDGYYLPVAAADRLFLATLESLHCLG